MLGTALRLRLRDRFVPPHVDTRQPRPRPQSAGDTAALLGASADPTPDRARLPNQGCTAMVSSHNIAIQWRRASPLEARRERCGVTVSLASCRLVALCIFLAPTKTPPRPR